MIKSEARERIARIRIERPEKKNAFTGRMYADLAKALRAADADAGVRAVLIHGSAECFTAGNDIADFLAPRAEGEAAPVAEVFRALPAASKPIVAAVGGPAVGIGTTMLLHCDLVYAAADARFQLPFVPLGIVPEFGSTFLLPLLAGYPRAAELLLLGEPFGAQKAYEIGIVTEVVPREELLARAEAAAKRLAELPPESIRLTKKLMRSAHAKPLGERIAEEARMVFERLRSPEAKEALRAFLEKRKPDFSRF